MAYPKFFKIIVNPRDNKLRIPTEYISRHGKNLADQVSLRTPNGCVREVQLLHRNDGTWLHKGWNDFKENYSIGFGHLLIFINDQNSLFDVLIFGMDGAEIEYPHDNANVPNRRENRVMETMDSESESEESVLLAKKVATNKKRMGREESVELADPNGNSDFLEIPKSASARQQERRRTRSNDDYMQHSDTLNETSTRAKERSRKKATSRSLDEPAGASRLKPEEHRDGHGKHSEKRIGNQSDKRVRRTVCKETSQAYRRAKTYKFCDPFSISLMQPSYVSCPSVLSIPFARKVLPGKHKELKLRNSEGKTWAVKCITGHHDSKLTIGWKEFVYDNTLKVGDVCVFEVNKSGPFVWEVTIFRG